jgi:hypothetical protein
MDFRRMLKCALALALVAGFAGRASASQVVAEEETTQVVDWDDAAYYAELMETYVDDNGVWLNVYYDEGQNVLWSQPVDVSLEEAAEALIKGSEHAETLLITQWVVPTVLWLCDYNESADANCTSGTNYKWGSGDFALDHVSGNYAYYTADDPPCEMTSIERVRAKGTSNYSDYCDDNYLGQYYHNGSWPTAEEYSCYLAYLKFYYDLDESTGLVNETYLSGAYVARFIYYSSGTQYRSYVSIATCITK